MEIDMQFSFFCHSSRSGSFCFSLFLLLSWFLFDSISQFASKFRCCPSCYNANKNFNSNNTAINCRKATATSSLGSSLKQEIDIYLLLDPMLVCWCSSRSSIQTNNNSNNERYVKVKMIKKRKRRIKRGEIGGGKTDKWRIFAFRPSVLSCSVQAIIPLALALTFAFTSTFIKISNCLLSNLKWPFVSLRFTYSMRFIL